ncbi:unnamed protein product [Ectocarpus sp. CCAP 1310/34]|nr:unnamed protein product [Ectocarpus sp. CCAP 1310/34]
MPSTVFQGKYEEADPLYLRAVEIGEKTLGPDHPTLAVWLNNKAATGVSCGVKLISQLLGGVVEKMFLRDLIFDSQTEIRLYHAAIKEKVLGPDHPSLATTLNNRAGLLEAQGKYVEAEPLYERSQAIREKSVGPEHPDVAQSLDNRAAGFFHHTRMAFSNVTWTVRFRGKYAEADPLYLRAIEIGEKMLGPDHPDLATRLNNRAWLLHSQGKHNEAIPRLERASSIRRKRLGEGHHSTADIQVALERVRKHVRDS